MHHRKSVIDRRSFLAGTALAALFAPSAKAWWMSSFTGFGANAPVIVGGGVLIQSETQGLGIDFTYDTDRSKIVSVKDTGTPANTGDYDPFARFVYQNPGVKLCLQKNGSWAYGNHNLCIQSQAFDDAAWTKTRASVTANSTTAPDGNSTADTLTEDSTASNTHFVTGTNAAVVSGIVVQLSVYAKPNGRSWIRLGDNNITNGGAYFDVTNGVTGTAEASNLTKSITSVGSGWYRCVITALTTSANSAVLINLASADNTISYTGAGTAGVFLWGAEIKYYPASEVGPLSGAQNAISYTPTLRGTPTTGQNTNGGNITLTLPTGLARDDVVYVFYAMNAAGTGGTSSTGWTQVGANVGATVRIQVFRKVMGASPDANIVLTGTAAAADSSSAIAIALYNVDINTPEDVALVSATGTSATPDPAAATPATTGAIAIAYAGCAVVDVTGITAPSGYSNLTTISSNDNNDTSGYLATKGSLTAGVSENPGTFGGGTSAAWATYTVIARPRSLQLGTTLTGYVPTRDGIPVYDIPFLWTAAAASLGVVSEDARTNIALRSRDMSATWVQENVTLTQNDTAAPDGTTTADKMAPSASATNEPDVYQTLSITSSVNYATSIFAKKSTHRYVILQFVGAAANYIVAVFDLDGGGTSATQTGSTGGTVLTTKQEDAGNGWFRLTLIGSVSANTEPYMIFGLAGAATGNTFGNYGYSGWAHGTTEAIWFWGMQCELGSFASSPIHTVAAQVTRPVDYLWMPSSYFPWSTTTHTIFSEHVNNRTETDAYHYPLAASNNSNSDLEWYGLGYSNTEFMFSDGYHNNASTGYVAPGGYALSQGATRKMAGGWNNATTFNLSIDGGTPPGPLTATTPMDELLRLEMAATGFYFRKAMYLPRMMSSSELIAQST